MSTKNAPNSDSRTIRGGRITQRKHFTMVRLGAQLLTAAMVLTPVAALSDYDDEPVQIVRIEMIEPAAPEPIPYNYQPVTRYAWTDDELKQVAKILWAETGKGNNHAEKQAICCLILNRTRFGTPFPADIVSVCKQPGEFNRGKVSNKNLEIARECLDLYQSHLDGNFQRIDFPQSAVYMSRTNGVLTFYDINWQKVYEVTK